MSTSTFRIDDDLRQRIARVAAANGQTPHGFMVRALAEKVDQAESMLALRDEAVQRHAAVLAGEPTVEWHDMRDWLRRRVKGPGAGGAQPARTRLQAAGPLSAAAAQLSTTLDSRRR